MSMIVMYLRLIFLAVNSSAQSDVLRMSGGSPQRVGGGAAARDGGGSDHGDDPDLQWTLHESLAASANEELPAPPRSSSSAAEDAGLQGPEAAEHGEGAAPAGAATPSQKSCKISAEDARAIFQDKPLGKRKRNRSGECASSKLAQRYGITTKAVRDIWTGRTWAKVTGQSKTQAGHAPQNAGSDGAQVARELLVAWHTFSDDVAEPQVRALAPAAPGGSWVGVGGGAGIVVGAEASPALQHHAAAHGAPGHFHLLPWPPPDSLGLNGNPVQHASGALSPRRNPVAHPEGVAGFHEARRGGRDHWPEGITGFHGAPLPPPLRSAAPMMRQHFWALMGHRQGLTGTAGNMIGRASPALGHDTTAHGGWGSSFAPALLARAQAQAQAQAQQNRGPHTHDLPAPAANIVAPSRKGVGEMVNFYAGPGARPTCAHASASLPTPASTMRYDGLFQDCAQRLSPSATSGDGADMKTMDGPGCYSGPVHGADDSTWGDRSSAQGATNMEPAWSGSNSGSSGSDGESSSGSSGSGSNSWASKTSGSSSSTPAGSDSSLANKPAPGWWGWSSGSSLGSDAGGSGGVRPFTFGQALDGLSGCPLPPDFHVPDGLDTHIKG